MKITTACPLWTSAPHWAVRCLREPRRSCSSGQRRGRSHRPAHSLRTDTVAGSCVALATVLAVALALDCFAPRVHRCYPGSRRPGVSPKSVYWEGQAVGGSRRVLSDELGTDRAAAAAGKGPLGRPFRDHRQVIEGIVYRYRAGIAWRDLPAEFGPWQTAWKRHRRFSLDGHMGRHRRPVPRRKGLQARRGRPVTPVSYSRVASLRRRRAIVID